ncbi:MAG: hypothetical protein SGI99_10000 [Pseudomonadota bacterium]|nr:hypothetical protein [Pseudomonadota bacterium]
MRVHRAWRFLLIILALGASLLAFGLWRLSRDDERLTRWLTDSVQAATGLQMSVQGTGRFGFWPRLSIALAGVQLRSIGDAGSPVRIGSMRVQVPWSSVFGRELRISAIVMNDVVLDAVAINAWLARRRDIGPMPALRWPQLDASLSIHRLRYRAPDARGLAVDTFVLDELQLDRWQIDQPAVLDASFVLTALGPQAFQLQVQCTPRQSGTSIAIEPCAATLQSGENDALALRGYLRHDDVARVESQLRIEALQLPRWINLAPIRTQPKPVDLALRMVGSVAGPLKARLGGNLSGIGVETDVVLPYGWIDQIRAGEWNALAERTTGFARVDHLRAADVATAGNRKGSIETGVIELDDIEWRNDTAAESSLSSVVPTNQAQPVQRR